MKYNIEYLNPTEYKVTFSDCKEYILREYYDCEKDFNDYGIEVWDATDTKYLYAVSGASLLDSEDEDAPEYNQKEIEYIEKYGFDFYF
jgi:hypothetical protein